MLDTFQLIHAAVGIIALWSLNYFYLRGKDEEIKRLRNNNEELAKTLNKKQLSIDALDAKVVFLEKKLDLTKECSDQHLKEIDRLSFQLNETKEKIKMLSKSNVETFKAFAQINFELTEKKEKFRK